MTGSRNAGREASPWLPVAMVLCGTAIMLLWWKPWRYSESFGPSQRAVGTVIELKSGFQGKYRSAFTHQIRLADGSEGEATLRQAFSPGTRLRMLYSLGTRRHLRVYAFEVCSSDCTP